MRMRHPSFWLTIVAVTMFCNIGYAKECQLLHDMQEQLKVRKTFGLTIHTEYDGNGDLSHLGVSLFTPEYQKVIDTHLWQATERMLLELVLQPDDRHRQTWLKERNSSLWLEAKRFRSSTFSSFDQAIPILKNVKALMLNEDDDRYRLILYGGPDSTLLRLSFPKERELIFGTDKKEEDECISNYLSQYQGPIEYPSLPSREELIPTSYAQIWHTPGEALYIDSLRNDSYYTWSEADPTVRPLDSGQYPRESVINLLLGVVNHPDLKVDVMHRQYGNVVKEWNSSWDMLRSALCSPERTKAYAAVTTSSYGTLNGVLVLYNAAFDYAHMLIVSVPANLPGCQEPMTMQALLYTNIPQHNILSLFEERQRPVNSSVNRPTKVYNLPIDKK